MPLDSPSPPVLRVGPVLGSVWSVLRTHAAVLVGLAVVLHFVAWKLAGDVQADVLAYVGQTFRVDLPELAGRLVSAWSDSVPELLQEVGGETRALLDQVGGAAVSLAYGVFMQVAVAELMFGAPDPSPAAAPRTASTQVAARFQRAEFLFDMARSLGILLVIYATITVNGAALGLAMFVFELETFHFLHSVTLIRGLFTLAAALAFAASVLIISLRWFVAVPTTIVENAGVLESLRRSWRLTGPCWKKLVVLNLLLQMPFELVMPALDALAGFGDDSPARAFVAWGVLTVGRTMVAAVLSSVCYDHLRRAGRPPEPVATSPAVP